MTLSEAWMDWLRFTVGFLDVAADVMLQRWRARHLPSLDHLDADVAGRTIIVTGPTSSAASGGRQRLPSCGDEQMAMVLACRSADRGAALLAALTDEAHAAGIESPCIEVRLLDVSSLASVRRFAEKWAASARPLHVLINNAGIYSFAEQRAVTGDGLECHMATNCLGPHLLTVLLLPSLRAAAEAPGAPPARVVNLSSRMHRLVRLRRADPLLACGYSSVSAYGGSKLAQVALTADLQRRLIAAEAPVLCFSADPGEVLTDITRTLPQPLRWGYQNLLQQILFTTEQGARTSLHCAGSRSALQQHSGATGCYFASTCAPTTVSAVAADPGLARWLWPWAAETIGATAADVDAAWAPMRSRQH